MCVCVCVYVCVCARMCIYNMHVIALIGELFAWRPHWMGVKSLYVLIRMMGADLSHELPSNHQRDTLINPVAANALRGTVEYTVGISPHLVYGTGSYSQGHRTKLAVDPALIHCRELSNYPQLSSKLWI